MTHVSYRLVPPSDDGRHGQQSTPLVFVPVALVQSTTWRLIYILIGQAQSRGSEHDGEPSEESSDDSVTC